MAFTRRVRHLREEGAYVVLRKAQRLEREGRKIIHLEIGQPDVETFSNIAAAGTAAIKNGKTRYTLPAGLLELRETVAEVVGSSRGIAVDPEEVIIAPGSKPVLFFPTLALVNPGDEVLYPDPGFPTYEAMIRVAGGKPVPVPLSEERGFSLDVDAVARLMSYRTRMIILNSPGNPTGGVMPASDLERIAALACERDCFILSDEIYSRLIYDGATFASIASLPDMKPRTILVDGFSKTYAMTGWRLGYGVMPKALAQRVSLLLTHSVGCTACFTQYAGIEAMTGPQDRVERVRQEYQRRRDAIVAGLQEIPGITCQTPGGAFYAFPNVRSLGKPVDELADYLLEQAGVAVLPGTAFGSRGEGYLRISYANSLANIEQGLEQIRQALGRLS